MKKIIAAFDGFDLSNATLQYAIQISKSSRAHLVGIFLDDFTYHRYQFADILDHEEGGISDKKIAALDNEDEKVREMSVDKFENACKHEGLNFSIHRDRNIALQDLLHESIYADLLVIDKKEAFNKFDKETPTRFIRDLLADVQCPVLVVPHSYEPIVKTVLLYDGQPSSVFAVKMFSYLLPTVKHEPAEVLTIRDQKNSLHVPDAKLMKEFMKRHCPQADFIVEKGEPEEEILAYLAQQQQNCLVVLGAYQRSRVSRWFKPSMADRLIMHLNLPLFIAHNK